MKMKCHSSSKTILLQLRILFSIHKYLTFRTFLPHQNQTNKQKKKNPTKKKILNTLSLIPNFSAHKNAATQKTFAQDAEGCPLDQQKKKKQRKQEKEHHPCII